MKLILYSVYDFYCTTKPSVNFVFVLEASDQFNQRREPVPSNITLQFIRFTQVAQVGTQESWVPMGSF